MDSHHGSCCSGPRLKPKPGVSPNKQVTESTDGTKVATETDHPSLYLWGLDCRN